MAAKEGLLSKIHINENREELFVGIPIDLSISGFDSKINPIKIDSEEIQWSVLDNKGTFGGDVFTATAKGEIIIIAEYKGYKDAIMRQTMENGVAGVEYYVMNWGELDNLVNPSLAPVWLGEKTAKQALEEIEEKANALVIGRYGF